jgi:hypothetical protein
LACGAAWLAPAGTSVKICIGGNAEGDDGGSAAGGGSCCGFAATASPVGRAELETATFVGGDSAGCTVEGAGCAVTGSVAGDGGRSVGSDAGVAGVAGVAATGAGPMVMARGVTCLSSDPNVLMPTTTETAAISPTRANVPLDGILPLPFGLLGHRAIRAKARPADVEYTILARHQYGRVAAMPGRSLGPGPWRKVETVGSPSGNR